MWGRQKHLISTVLYNDVVNNIHDVDFYALNEIGWAGVLKVVGCEKAVERQIVLSAINLVLLTSVVVVFQSVYI